MMPLEQKIKSMTGDEIVMAMVNGIKKEWVKLDFETFGQVRKAGFFRRKVCFGCAATNAVCEIMGQDIPASYVGSSPDRAVWWNVDYRFLQNFESAIDELRKGRIGNYNHFAKLAGFSELPKVELRSFELPKLENRKYSSLLNYYVLYANYIKDTADENTN